MNDQPVPPDPVTTIGTDSGVGSDALTAEERRLREARDGVPWRLLGPYLSERQWGTVREDLGDDDGATWAYFPHDHARSRAYRSGEDGLAGVCDQHQRMCFALALWNERDPIVKERLFGLTNDEGNHGEDVKEYYFYSDNTPSHAYQRWLYKYPQAVFPYDDLVAENARRSRYEPEYELLDTGVFDDDRYFDVEVEHAKAEPDDLVCRITVHNRGPEAAPIHLLPSLWFRNTWSFPPYSPQPSLRRAADAVIAASHHELGGWHLYADDGAATEVLFCDNESNAERLWGAAPTTDCPKDGINDHVTAGRTTVRDDAGTKAAFHRRMSVPAGGSVTMWLRLARHDTPVAEPLAQCDAVLARRRAEADEFYAAITPPSVSADEAAVLRQALAGMLWTKQSYLFDLDTWLRERGAHPLRRPTRSHSRNSEWFHMNNHDVISMPDKWEYPWYAAWDLAFHALPLAMVDPDFAMAQLELMVSQGYLHPNGQMPAYEWDFGDVNPPVHAFATLFLHSFLGNLCATDRAFLQSSFQRLLLNFTWWVNRKDPEGRNLFEGGFLGLDNIGVFDRSEPAPGGGQLEQADGTGWMALFSQNMLELALELYADDDSYRTMVEKFVEHFFWIAAAVDPGIDGGTGGVGGADDLWDDEDGFFYDVLRHPDGHGERLRVRSMVGLLPLCATTVISAEVLERDPELAARIEQFVQRNGDLLGKIHDPLAEGVDGRRMLSLVDETKLRRILERVLDEEQFLAPTGIRSLSRDHLAAPFEMTCNGHPYSVGYVPGESTSHMFGGNSNWRGPVWFPTNVLIIRALLQHYRFYGDSLRVECPTGSGVHKTLFEVAAEVARRLVATFLPDPGRGGRRPVFGDADKFQTDPLWRDHLLFYEYFHGDDGHGLGASHQTGWTGLVAPLIQLFAHLDADTALGPHDRPLSSPFRRVTGDAAMRSASARPSGDPLRGVPGSTTGS